MAWFGKIMDFQQTPLNTWVATVQYWDDSNPGLVIPRTLSWDISVTKAQVINDIKNKGTEVKNQSSINTSSIIGTVVPIV